MMIRFTTNGNKISEDKIEKFYKASKENKLHKIDNKIFIEKDLFGTILEDNTFDIKDYSSTSIFCGTSIITNLYEKYKQQEYLTILYEG